MVADHRRAFAALRPVAAGGVDVADDGHAVRLRAGQHVVHVRRVAAAVDAVAALGQCRLLAQAVDAVKLLHVGGHDCSLGVRPRPLADAVAGVHGRHVGGDLLAQVGTPGAVAGTCRRGERLALLVGAGQAAEVGAVAGPGAGDEEAHAGLAAGHAAAGGEQRGSNRHSDGRAGPAHGPGQRQG